MNFNEQNPLSLSSVAAAVKLNEVNVLQDLIKKGRNLNITDNRGWTPLHEAASLNHKECLKILLKAGARVNVFTHRGETPLFIACEYNCLESVKILIKWDSSMVNVSNNESVTPLHVCCTKHCVQIAKLLIKTNAMINAEDNSGITPLHEAILSKDMEICKLLIDNGVNLNSREYDGNLPFHFACMVGNIEITKLLLNCYESNINSVINEVNCDGFTPLMLAVQGVCVETAKELLFQGANPDLVNHDKTLALHLAVHTGNVDLLRCVYNATSKDSIKKYCTVTDEELKRSSDAYSCPIKSLVCLAIDSESIDCLDFILNCGLSYDVLNCPIVGPFVQRYVDKCRYLSLSNIIEDECACRTVRIVIHPMSFLLDEKSPDLKENTTKFLKCLLESGFIFDSFSYKTDFILLHPLEILVCHMSRYGEKLKAIIIECLYLIVEHGVSVDFTSPFYSDNAIPILFIYACQFGLIEIIPFLLKNSNLVEINDLFKWTVGYIFNNKSPASVEPVAADIIKTFHFLKNFTTLQPNLSEFKNPDVENCYFVDGFTNDIDFAIPCLKSMCRTVIRRTIHDSCRLCPHQFKLRLNSLQLPTSVLYYLNYEDIWNYKAEKT